MSVIESIEWQGVSGLACWRPGFTPTADIRQVSGVCLTDDNRIVLVSEDGQRWSLPGGKPEAGESWADTLKREVREEACAEVLMSHDLGTQRIEGLTVTPYHQMRFYAWVQLSPFRANFETRFRRTMPPEEFVETLNWGGGLIARAILEAALACRDL